MFLHSKKRLDIISIIALILVFLMSSGFGMQPKQSTDDLVFSVKNVSFTMKYVEGGTFQMGATPEQYIDRLSHYNVPADDEKPAHPVTLSSYYIGETEVTQGLWKAVMGSNPSYFNTRGANSPVECITWYDAVMFCNKLSEATNRNPVYTITDIQYGENENKNSIVKATVTADSSKNGFCLPTEAQWEYAARGGNKSKGYKYSGSETLDWVAWYDGGWYGVGSTHLVSQKKANELDIYDMTGNVCEWCYDLYKKDYYADCPLNNPQGPSSGGSRVFRGGSWQDFPSHCRVPYRGRNGPSYRYQSCGMRLALPFPQSKI